MLAENNRHLLRLLQSLNPMSRIQQLFKNQHGFNTMKVVLDNGIELYYHLFDNPVQHAWQALVKTGTDIDSVFSNKPVIDYIEELNTLADKLGFRRIAKVPAIDELNAIHSLFVSNPDNEDWKRVNHLVHIIENNLIMDLNYKLQFSMAGIGADIPIEEHHKLWLSTNASDWGSLFLGYETVGKDWGDIAMDNDSVDDLAVQTYMGTEAVMSFCSQAPYEKLIENDFYKWYLNSPQQAPINNLNQLALGRYVLGQLIITETFINFNSNPLVWYMPNHVVKRQWNQEVLTSANYVDSISFFESNMLYETLMKHTNNEISY
jgi:hypothetical protein